MLSIVSLMETILLISYKAGMPLLGLCKCNIWRNSLLELKLYLVNMVGSFGL